MLTTFHASALGSRSRVKGTYQRVKQPVYLPRMKHEVVEYVQAWNACPRNKGEQTSNPRLLQPDIPIGAWTCVSINFIEIVKICFEFEYVYKTR